MVHLYANFSTNTFSLKESLNVASTRDLEDPVDSPSCIIAIRLTSALYIGYNLAGHACAIARCCAVEIEGCGLL